MVRCGGMYPGLGGCEGGVAAGSAKGCGGDRVGYTTGYANRTGERMGEMGLYTGGGSWYGVYSSSSTEACLSQRRTRADRTACGDLLVSGCAKRQSAPSGQCPAMKFSHTSPGSVNLSTTAAFAEKKHDARFPLIITPPPRMRQFTG